MVVVPNLYVDSDINIETDISKKEILLINTSSLCTTDTVPAIPRFESKILEDLESSPVLDIDSAKIAMTTLIRLASSNPEALTEAAKTLNIFQETETNTIAYEHCIDPFVTLFRSLAHTVANNASQKIGQNIDVNVDFSLQLNVSDDTKLRPLLSSGDKCSVRGKEERRSIDDVCIKYFGM